MGVYNAGDYPVDHADVEIPFNTFTSNDPAASSTITDLATTDIHIHKDAGLTQRDDDAGIAVVINLDSITGNHLVTIDLSDNTDAGFYAAGSEYMVRMEGTTVDGATINAWIGAFSIERAGGVLALLKTINIANGAVEADLTYIHGTALTETAGQLAASFKKLFDVATPLLVASDVMRGTDSANTTVPDAAGTAPTAVEIQAEIEGNGASILDTLRDDLADGGRLDLLIDAIKAKTDNLPADPADDSDIDTQLAAIKAETALIVADTNELQADDYPTSIAAIKAETALIVADTNELQTDDIPAALATIAAYLDTEIAAIDTVVDAIKVTTDKLDDTLEDDGGTNRFTENALEEAPSGTGGDATAANQTTIISNLATVDTVVDAIKDKTDNLPAAVKKNTALNNFKFFMVDSTDSKTGKTGLTVTAERSIDDGAFSSCSNSVVETANGWYRINLSAADLNGGTIALKFTASGADARNIGFVTNP